MARVRDLWYDKDRRKTARHPDKGGNKNARRWLAVWAAADGTETSRAFAKRSDAERHATLQEADAQRGISSADPKRAAITVRDYGESKFLPSMLHLRPNSADTYTSHLRNHIYPLLGNRRLGTITRSDVQAFVSAVSCKVAPSTTETVYAVLRAMMQHAVDDDPQVIPANPCTRIKLPKSRKRVVEPLSPTAVLALLDTITPRYRVAAVLGVGLGLREGEAFGLTLPRVDFLRRKVQVLSQAQRGQLAADLKTEASTRTIPADDWVLNQISGHIQRFGTGPGEAIVTNRLGKVAQRNSFGDRWRLAVAEARTCGRSPAAPFEGGMCGERCADPAHCLPKGTRFHDLRHFYVSTLIAANLNPKVIQARLGHATITETMDTYGHLFPDAEDLGRGAIDTIFAVALTEQGRNQETR
jgi:integrase